jgi:4'-phosphopantetheinyl transferase
MNLMDVYWLEQAAADVPGEDDWLSANEVTRLKGMRFAKRRGDWRLGRWTAKRAVSVYLGVPAHPRVFKQIDVRPAASGAPEVFFANQLAALSISLSHRDGVAACAVAMSGVNMGCDLEIVEPRSDAFIQDYFTIEEQSLLAGVSAAQRPRLLALLWSAKESALKALHEGLRLDTRSVIVSPFAAPCDLNGWSSLQVRHTGGQVFHGWWQNTANILRTVVATQPLNSPIRLAIPPHFFDCASRCA